MNSKSARTVFFLGLIMLIYSCGKDIAKAVASVASNTTTAPWRMTRADLGANFVLESDAVKDNVCRSEFGTDYVAGRYTEFANYGGGNGVELDTQLVFAASDYAYISGGTSNMRPVRVHLFCIHK